jgi:AraC-like DNA-binding protein
LQLTGEGFTEFPLLAIFLISAISFQTIIYFYQAYDFLQEYEAAAKEKSASVSLLAADWLKKLSIAFCLFVVIFYLAAAELFFLYEYRQYMLSPDLFSFGIAGFIFLVSWHMYRNPELFALYTPGLLPQAEPVRGKGNRKKYEKTKLPPEQMVKYEKRLLECMGREQPYLDGELRLSQLAESLDMPAHHLSQVINVTRQQTFFDFINRHRINHAESLLIDPNSASNMLEIALASGFNSKASFNRIFKKETGMTPSAFQKRESGTETREYLTR